MADQKKKTKKRIHCGLMHSSVVIKIYDCKCKCNICWLCKYLHKISFDLFEWN